MLPFLPLIVILALVVGGIFYSMHVEKKRKEALEKTAEELGLVFQPDNEELQHRFSHFKLFNSGRKRTLYNVITGDSGEVRISIFDYKYTTGSGKHQQTQKQTVAAIQSSELMGQPSFRMRPEGFFDKVGSAMGFQDIDFDSHPTFSKLFVLQGENEEAIREFFTPALLEFFETKQGYCVEASEDAMFFYRPRRKINPDQIKELLGETYEVFGHMVDR